MTDQSHLSSSRRQRAGFSLFNRSALIFSDGITRFHQKQDSFLNLKCLLRTVSVNCVSKQGLLERSVSALQVFMTVKLYHKKKLGSDLRPTILYVPIQRRKKLVSNLAGKFGQPLSTANTTWGLFYLSGSAPKCSPTRCTSVLLCVDAKRTRCSTDCKQTGHVTQMAVQGNAAFSSNSQKSCLGVVLMLNEALFGTQEEEQSVEGRRGLLGALLSSL